MRVLYVASAVEADGTAGGSTHVQEVACGLRELGHKVEVVSRSGGGSAESLLTCGVPLLRVRWRKEFALLGWRQVAHAIGAFRPDVVMERFYNFAGAGVWQAHHAGIPLLLEVNAPMTDPPGSSKSRLDTLLFGAMRRWAVRQALWSHVIVTPLATTVPREVSRNKIRELPWGANVEHFSPALRVEAQAEVEKLARNLGLQRDLPIAAFLGSFRGWHGVNHFVEAARLLLRSGAKIQFLAIGGGPELAGLKKRVADMNLPLGRIVFAGPQPHEKVPLYLALADIGVAPFDVAAHPPLRYFGFYWSPLKVFEYMAMALPVVTIDLPPLNTIARSDREGLLYTPGNVPALAAAIKRLADDATLRKRLGEAGRARVIAYYSWQEHCRSLDKLLGEITVAA